MKLAETLGRCSAAVVAAAAMSTASAHAATISFNSSNAAWETSGNVVGLQGEGTDQMSWGLGHSKGGGRQSAYSFDGINPGVQAGTGELVTLGTFTHDNFRIQTGRNLRNARLDFDLGFSFDLGGNLHREELSFNWLFKHHETLNQARPCANGKRNWTGLNRNGCADSVTFSDEGDRLFTFDYAEGTVTLELLGFSPQSPFWTVENRSNATDLHARFSFAPAPIPLPAAGWLLLGALAGLAVLRHRRLPCSE